jgi:tetratricopeptide (TPR) repeat protein
MRPALPNFDDLWDYNKPDASEIKFRALLPRAEQHEDRSYLVQLLTQIARAEALQRKFAEAHQTLDRAQALLTDDMTRAKIRYVLERGRVFNSSNHPDEARRLFLDAWEQASTAQEDFYAIDAAHMLGIVEPPEQKMTWNLKALTLTEQTSDTRARKWAGSLCNNIGWAYHDAGDYAQALEYFQKALAFQQATGKPDEIRIARWAVARAQRSLGEIQTALATQRVLLEELESSGETDGYVNEELGECLLALGQANGATPYFARAYAELSKDPWLAEAEPARLQRLKESGNA